MNVKNIPSADMYTHCIDAYINVCACVRARCVVTYMYNNKCIMYICKKIKYDSEKDIERERTVDGVCV